MDLCFCPLGRCARADPIAGAANCGEPFNLNVIEERHLILRDAVVDSNSQLLFDRSGVHKDNLYGDINLVRCSHMPFVATVCLHR